jgi:hypothetical protein
MLTLRMSSFLLIAIIAILKRVPLGNGHPGVRSQNDSLATLPV